MGVVGPLQQSDRISSRQPYLGTAGIALFYLELHQATQQSRFLQIAMAAGDEVIAQLPRLSPTCAPSRCFSAHCAEA